MFYAELYPENDSVSLDSVEELDLLGEGGINGEIDTRKGFVFSVLEVCLCLLAKQIPAINPNTSISPVSAHQKCSTSELNQLITVVINAFESLPNLCSPTGAMHLIYYSTITVISLFFFPPVNSARLIYRSD